MSDQMREMSGQELGNKLLKSVKEMRAGKAARVTKVAPNQVAAARLKNRTVSDTICAGITDFSAHTAGMGARTQRTIGSGKSADPDCVLTPENNQGKVGESGAKSVAAMEDRL